MNLKTNIKKNLFEKKEEKKSLIKESEIIESRFSILMDSVKIRSKKNYNKMLTLLMIESISLYDRGLNQKLISENLDNVLGTLDILFKGSNRPAIEVFKDKGIRWIINQLSISDTSLREFLLDHLMKTELIDIPKLFSDCSFLKKRIAEAIPYYYNEKISFEESSGSGDEFMNVVSGSLKSVIKDSDLDGRIESKLSGIVCPIVSKLKEKFENYLNDIKKKLVSQEKGMQM